MKAVVLLALVGCGRIGFDAAARTTDGAIDTATDTAIDTMVDAQNCSTATFDTLPTYLTVFKTGGTVTTNGALTCAVNAAAGSSAGVNSTPPVSFSGRSMSVRVVQSTSSPIAYNGPGWHFGDGSSIHFHIIGGNLEYRNNVAVAASTAYNPAQHAWLRLRENGGKVAAETSSDGIGWNPFGVITVPDASGTYLDLGTDTSTGLPGNDIGVFDDLVICPPI